MPDSNEMKSIGIFSGGLGFLLIVIVGFICLAMYGCPQYNVWQQGLSGQAKLREAEYSRQILVEEAKAEKEAATLKKDAEIIRSHGLAEAIAIVGESLKGNEQYLRYLWVQGLHDGSSELIYVPTEAGLPILEAGRLGKRKSQKQVDQD